MRSVVRNHLVTLVLAMSAATVSFAFGTFVENAFHVSGWFMALPLSFVLVQLVIKFGPDGGR
jgi:hypothetical protein